jgi:hypothetical protein
VKKRGDANFDAGNFDVLSRARVEDTEANDEGLVQEGSG